MRSVLCLLACLSSTVAGGRAAELPRGLIVHIGGDSVLMSGMDGTLYRLR